MANIGHLYRHPSYVDLKQYEFVWQYAFLDTVKLKAFQNAVHRYARRLQLLRNRRLHTTLPCAAKEAYDYEAFERFIQIEYPGGSCVLRP